MEEKLDFSLPQNKGRAGAASKISVALLLIVIGLVVANLIVKQPAGGGVSEAGPQGLSAEKTRLLASKLARRNLYRPAARVWQDYLALGKLSDADRARALFQTGTLLEKADALDEAIEYYYRSEMASKLDDLEPQIDAHIKDCFARLGKFSALRYELMDRTSFKATDEAGGKVVAEIGAEKITEADLDAIIEGDIDNQLSSMAAFMTTEQLNEQKKKMLEQYKSSQARQQFLGSWLGQEILYREALSTNLAEKSEVKKVLDDLSRRVLSQHLMNRQLADKINVTETDLETYYTANKAQYLEPAKARISRILLEDEDQAKKLIERIRGGEDFAELAKEFSKDENTKNNGGKIDVDVTPGPYVPAIGDLKQLNEKIFASTAPAVLDEPIKSEDGWEVVKVESKTDETQKSFDEVRQQVISSLLGRKRQEVQQDFIKQMMDKYNVIIHSAGEQTETEQSKQSK